MGRTTPWAAMLIGIVVLGALALAVAAGAWRLDGGRWFVVATPSMGEHLPVGSLVLTTPTTIADVAADDVITFRSPDSGTVYTHRAVSVTPAGLTTRGDINGTADAWTVRDEDLIGSVAWNAPALGWLVRGLPLFFVGLAVVWLLTCRMGPARRYSWRLIGLSSSLAATTYFLKPWIGLERLNQRTPDEGSGVLVDVVSTGLLPIRAIEAEGDAVVSLVDGEVGTLHLTAGAETGAYDVLTQLDLSPAWWVAAIGFCLLPTMWTMVVGLAPDHPMDASGKHLHDPVSDPTPVTP